MMTVNLNRPHEKASKAADRLSSKQRGQGTLLKAFQSSLPSIVCAQELKDKWAFADNLEFATWLMAHSGDRAVWDHNVDVQAIQLSERDEKPQPAGNKEATIFWHTRRWKLVEDEDPAYVGSLQTLRNLLTDSGVDKGRLSLAYLAELDCVDPLLTPKQTGKKILVANYHGIYNNPSGNGTATDPQKLKDIKYVVEAVAELAKALSVWAVVAGDFNYDLVKHGMEGYLQPPAPNDDALPEYTVEVGCTFSCLAGCRHKQQTPTSSFYALQVKQPVGQGMANGHNDYFIIIKPLQLLGPLRSLLPRRSNIDMGVAGYDHRPVTMSFRLSDSPVVHLIEGVSVFPSYACATALLSDAKNITDFVWQLAG